MAEEKDFTGMETGITYSREERIYDAKAKELLSRRFVASFLVKELVPECKEMSYSEIAEKCLDSSYFSIPLVPGAEGVVEATDSVIKIDGMETRMDLCYRVKVPDGSGGYSVTNVEIEHQGQGNPGYPLESRGMFYLGRMLSVQGDVVAGGMYGRLRKCRSIWIITDPPAEDRDSVSIIRMSEVMKTGGAKTPVSAYDKAELVMIRLGGKERSGNRLVQFMKDLFDSSCPREHFEREYGIEMTESDEKERRDIMGSGHALVEKGVGIGVGIGKDELVRTMLRNGATPEYVSAMTEIALEEIQRIGAEN